MEEFVVIVFGKTFTEIFAFCLEDQLPEVISRVTHNALYDGYDVFKKVER